MVEYYKTSKGYCYKKTQKGGASRISVKDYEKKMKQNTNKLKGGSLINNNTIQNQKNKDEVEAIVQGNIKNILSIADKSKNGPN